MRFETQFTRDFIKRSLPAGARLVLEIGCGSGELAAGLLQDGVTLIAIDNDADFVATAQELGVDARIAVWPDFEDGQFDAVLFTRSLHHIHPLDKAVQRGRPIVWSSAGESSWKTLPTKQSTKERCNGLPM